MKSLTRNFHFPFIFQLRVTPNLLNAATSSVSRILLQASQASDVGSIPIVRSNKIGSGYIGNQWKDTDPDLPILVAAKSEYSKIQLTPALSADIVEHFTICKESP
jgi:hypothetical protein